MVILYAGYRFLRYAIFQSREIHTILYQIVLNYIYIVYRTRKKYLHMTNSSNNKSNHIHDNNIWNFEKIFLELSKYRQFIILTKSKTYFLRQNILSYI